MNYDFNENERALFEDLQNRMTGLAEGKNLEDGKTDQINSHVRQAAAMFAETPYLKLGIEEVERLNGLLILTAGMEILASVSPSLCLAMEAGSRIFGRIVGAWGTPAQKERWLVPLLSGKQVGAVALSEETGNVDNDPLSTRGEPDKDEIVINGHKRFVINAPIADCIAVAGSLEKSPAIFLVEKDTPGLNIGERVNTLGYNGTVISEIRLENCRISSHQVIRPKAEQPLSAIRAWENQAIIGCSLGLMKTAFESAKTYAKTHKTGGKPIIAYQEIGFKLSEMLTLFQASQLLAYRTAWLCENDPKESEAMVLCAKVFCTESAEQITGEAMRVFGAFGYISGNAAGQAYRCAKYGQVAGTSTEIARVKIGDFALGMHL